MPPSLIADVNNAFNTWPLDIEHTRQNLERMATPEGEPRYEDSWTGDILTTLFRIFPPSAPEYYCHKPQYNLRAPLAFSEETRDAVDQLDNTRASLESHGIVVPGRGSGIADERCKPDIVIDQGVHLSQKLVALVEIKRTDELDKEGFDRFAKYCNAVLTMGPPGQLANVLLIAGGKVYHWRYQDIPFGRLSNRTLRAKEYCYVHDVRFLRLLARIRNDYVTALTSNQ